MLVEHLPEAGLAHAPPAGRLPGRVHFRQRCVGVLLDVGHQPGLRLGIQVAGAPAAGGLRGQRAGFTLLPQQFLDKRHTHGKALRHVCLAGTGLVAGGHHTGA